MDYRIQRITEKGKYRLYRRCWKEPGIARFVIFNIETNQQFMEYKTARQARNWLEKIGVKA